MSVRRAAVAGSWYPADARRLRAEVQNYLARASFAEGAMPDGPPCALVAPHAGLMYSGPVAAYAYRLLHAQSFDVIVLVGPSHFVAFDGVSVWPTGQFETPLGSLSVDAGLAAELLRTCPVVVDEPGAHTREHSLEMQLPFLAALVPEVPILPLVMGQQTRETAMALGDALGDALQGRTALIIASSDLSHYLDAVTALSLDRQVISDIDAFNDERLMARLERRPDHACGGGPIVSVMHASRKLGGSRSRVLHYADSGDVSGDKQSVVGYLAAAIWR
jgi:AmmeMemoRadiSam system protein B